MPPRLTEVGALERPDHSYLPRASKCFFWGEYTPYEHTNGKKWNFSPTNQLLSNFKKKMDRRALPDWQYKNQATQQIAAAFSQFWKWAELQRLHHVALIPIPPSKPRNDPLYDPRLVEMLNAIAARLSIPLDIRDCLSFSGRIEASHTADYRPSPDELFVEMRLDDKAARVTEVPGLIFLFDDMLTTGAHYVAASRCLADRFPGVQIVGNFISRRVITNPFADFGDFDAA